MVFSLKCPSDNHSITMASVQNRGTLEVVLFIKSQYYNNICIKNMKYQCTIFDITVDNRSFSFLYFCLYFLVLNSV